MDWCWECGALKVNPLLRCLANMVKLYSSCPSAVQMRLEYVSVLECTIYLSEFQRARLILKCDLQPNVVFLHVVHSIAPFAPHTPKNPSIRSYSLVFDLIRIRLTCMKSHYSVSADLSVNVHVCVNVFAIANIPVRSPENRFLVHSSFRMMKVS